MVGYNGAVEDPERYPIVGGVSMAVYMVERDLPDVTMQQLAGAQRAAIETSQRFTAGGKPVRHIRTTFVPGEARLNGNKTAATSVMSSERRGLA